MSKNTPPPQTVNQSKNRGEDSTMHKTKRGILGLILALGLAACGSNESTTDAAYVATPDTLPPQADAAVVAYDTGVVAIDTGVVPTPDPYVWVVIQDTEPKACSTNGPGSDVDAVALMGATGPIGYGKVGTAKFTANPAGNACENVHCTGGDCKYAAISDTFLEEDLVSWTEGEPDAMVSATADDYGYFSLNAGTLQMQIGDLTGVGPAQPIKSGDMIKVYEVDQTYITSGAAPTTCKCPPEHFTVSVQTATGATLPLKPTTLAADNATCSALTATSTEEGCGTTVFMVP